MFFRAECLPVGWQKDKNISPSEAARSQPYPDSQGRVLKIRKLKISLNSKTNKHTGSSTAEPSPAMVAPLPGRTSLTHRQTRSAAAPIAQSNKHNLAAKLSSRGSPTEHPPPF